MYDNSVRIISGDALGYVLAPTLKHLKYKLPTAFSRSWRFCSRSCLVSADNLCMRPASLEQSHLHR